MIDFHTHIFPDRIAKITIDKLKLTCRNAPQTDGTQNGLLNSAKAAGIDCSINLPVLTRPGQFESVHRFAEQLRDAPLISFGGIHPDTEDYKKELKFIRNHGLKGIKIHPDYQGVFIDDIRYKRIISYASELGLIVVTHAGYDSGYPEITHCTPERIIRMVEEVQPEKLVLAHMGGMMMWEEVEKNLTGLPVWFDTAVVFGYIDDEQFIRIARKQGIERILFASDSPWGNQTWFAEHLWTLPLTEDEKQKIAHINAEKLLGMKIPSGQLYHK